MIAAHLRRGMLAGIVAGLLAGGFAFVFGEPALDSAIELEEASAHDASEKLSHDEEPLFSRNGQKVGLLFATGLFGVTSGGVFGLVYWYFRLRLRATTEWGRSLTLAGAGFLAVFLVPFLKYPASPPAVGDPETIGTRTTAYFIVLALSLAVVFGAWLVAKMLRERGVAGPTRQTLVSVGSIVTLAAAFFLLPDAADPGDFPAGLLWEFRMASLGTQAFFWVSLGVVFGLLGERAARSKSEVVS